MDGDGAAQGAAAEVDEALRLTRSADGLIAARRGYEAVPNGVGTWTVWNTRARVWDEEMLSRDAEERWACRERVGEAVGFREVLVLMRRCSAATPAGAQ